MSNYTYTSGRPAGNISPAAQRASMQENNDNNALIWTQDHYGFNDNSGGTHKFVRLPSNNTPSPPSAPSFQASIYTAAGLANTATSQILSQLPTISLPMTAVRAFGIFDGTASSPITPGNSYNVNQITRGGNGQYSITLTTGCTKGTNFIVIANSAALTSSSVGVVSYTITGEGTFNLTTYPGFVFSLINSTSVSFVVLQF